MAELKLTERPRHAAVSNKCSLFDELIAQFTSQNIVPSRVTLVVNENSRSVSLFPASSQVEKVSGELQNSF